MICIRDLSFLDGVILAGFELWSRRVLDELNIESEVLSRA